MSIKARLGAGIATALLVYVGVSSPAYAASNNITNSSRSAGWIDTICSTGSGYTLFAGQSSGSRCSYTTKFKIQSGCSGQLTADPYWGYSGGVWYNMASGWVNTISVSC